MDYTIVVGLEVHVQLLTRSKLFCGCPNRFNPDEPNTQTCPVCLGLPGSLPVMNRRAFELSLKTAIALNCKIARFTKWDRKQYYYPDLPRGYQISQYGLPFSHDGWLDIELEDGEPRRIRIIRAHLEEDAGRNLHDESGRGRESRVDLNRTGTPLLEIVSHPDIRSPAEARTYLEELRLLLTFLDVSDCNMQEGSLRCDANINLHIPREDGSTVATPVVEVKNMNSFRNVELALEYEARRQFAEWRDTGETIDDVSKQTRGWDAQRAVTFAQRGKEEASDYRYFPDPDLVSVTMTDDEVSVLRKAVCEFPAARRKRFQDELGLSAYDSQVIVSQGGSFADYFEQTAEQCGDAKQAANWITQDVQRELNERHCGIEDFALPAAVLADLLKRVQQRTLTTSSAREVFSLLVVSIDNGQPVDADRIDAIVQERGLATVSDTGELDSVISAVIERNEKASEDFRSGKQAAIGRLIGEVMREIKGADPRTVRTRIIELLG